MKVATQSSQTMQRVRVGLIGLAAVVFLIGLAAALFSAASRDRPAAVDVRAGDPLNTAAANVADPAKEPLAEIGVAPATADSNAVAESRR